MQIYIPWFISKFICYNIKQNIFVIYEILISILKNKFNRWMAFKKHNYISERIMNVIKKNVLLYHYLNLRSQFSYVLIFLSNKSGVECVFFSSFSPILIFLLGVHTRTHCFDYLIIPVKGVKSIRKKDNLFWSHLENRKESSYFLALREEVWHPCFLSGQVWQLWQLDLSEIGRVKKR